MNLRDRIDALFTKPGTDDAWAAEHAAVRVDVDALFALVEPAPHWRAPIDAVVPVTVDLTDLTAAIEFLTATTPSFTLTADGWKVTAPGYAAGPAGDH